MRDKLRVRYALNSTPMVFGNRGRTLLGGDQPNVLRIGDVIQQLFENPDGNGIPFFSEPGGVGGDNALVQGFTNDLLSGVTPFDLAMKHQTQDLDFTYRAASFWTVGFDYQQHSSDGRQPLGSGSYQRITDVDGDGSTDGLRLLLLDPRPGAATSFGAALSFRSEDGRRKFDLSVDYLDAGIEQLNVNPDTPRDLGKADTPPVIVAQAFDFPEQTNTFTEIEAKHVRKLTDTMSCGIMYTFEDWDLRDFQLQQLDAYGANFLTVDEATRYMFLDAWYGSFDAHVGQLFVKMSF